MIDDLSLLILHRPYLHLYSNSNELEDVGIISLEGAKVENDSTLEALFGVCLRNNSSVILPDRIYQKPFVFTLFTPTNSYALADSNAKEFQSWISRLDPTRFLS